MNKLSWLIYFAELGGDINVICGFILLSAAVAAGVSGARWGWHKSGLSDNYMEEDAVKASSSLRAFKWIIGVAMAAGVVGAIVPERSTFYAIAASEMGEDVMRSQTATKAIKALDIWLDKQIKEAN